jgi:uncharacterized protein (TIGR04255 family)
MVKKLTGLLPDFEKPPVVEVAVMVQFEAPILGIPQIMRWWSQVQKEFPGFEQAPPIPPATESFDVPRVPQPFVQFQLLDAPPVPRVFMKKAANTELIQIQQDRFGYSWRKLKPDDDYPRYVVIKDSFSQQLALFEQFLASERLEPMKVTLCEVTYVNHILSSDIWHGHSELHKVIPSVTPKLSDNFLPLPEDMQLAARYIIDTNKNPLGRLYVAIEPRFLTADMTPIFLMRLTARGAPEGPHHEGILKMLDIGHEWIVRGFTTLTSPEMHKAWRRIR